MQLNIKSPANKKNSEEEIKKKILDDEATSKLIATFKYMKESGILDKYDKMIQQKLDKMKKQ